MQTFTQMIMSKNGKIAYLHRYRIMKSNRGPRWKNLGPNVWGTESALKKKGSRASWGTKMMLLVTQNDKCQAETSPMFHLTADLRQKAPWRTAFLPIYCQECACFSFRGLTFGLQVLGEKYPILSFLCSHCLSWAHPRGASCLTVVESGVEKMCRERSQCMTSRT